MLENQTIDLNSYRNIGLYYNVSVRSENSRPIRETSKDYFVNYMLSLWFKSRTLVYEQHSIPPNMFFQLSVPLNMFFHFSKVALYHSIHALHSFV